MAEPQDSYPESATLGAHKAATNGEGREAIEEALASNGEGLAAVIEQTDELENALETAILVAATADDEEVEYVTDSTANLVAAVDGLSTAETAALAETVGEDADELGEALETVLELQRAGHLDDLADLARTLSTLEIDEDTARGLNAVLAAVGEAERDSEPVGLLGAVGGLRSADGRAGLGYVVAVLKAVGRRLRGR